MITARSHDRSRRTNGARAARRPRARDRSLAFRPGDRLPVLARSREDAGVGSAQGDQRLRRPRQVRRLPGRMAARRPGAALGAEGATRTSRSTSSRPAAAPACRSRASASTTSASTTRTFSDTLPDDAFPQGRRLADGRPERAAPAAPRGRAPGAASRRHLLHGRSRSALGDQADQDAARWSRSRPTSGTSSIRR